MNVSDWELGSFRALVRGSRWARRGEVACPRETMLLLTLADFSSERPASHRVASRTPTSGVAGGCLLSVWVFVGVLI